MTWGFPVLLGAAIFAIALLYMGRFSIVMSAILDGARSLADVFYFRVNHSTEQERLFVVGLGLIMVTIFAVSRTARS